MSTENLHIISQNLLEQQHNFLEELAEKFSTPLSYRNKIDLLDQYPQVQIFLTNMPVLQEVSKDLPVEKVYLLKVVILIGQGHLFRGIETRESPKRALMQVLGELWQVEVFYRKLGGIIGYQKMLVRLLLEEEMITATKEIVPLSVEYQTPEPIDVGEDSLAVRQAVFKALASQERCVEAYPMGGAGDRLGLRDEKGNGLPAARLKFLGYTLLEGMVRDLAAREFLIYQLFGKRIETPILLMTSREKDNHKYVRMICNQQHWFGRSKEHFFFLTQPLVPSCDREAQWVVTEPLRFLGKPNGHGAFLYLAAQKGGYDWVEAKGKEYLFFRQVNNPIAGIDNGLLAFIGMAYQMKKDFGFASCPRRKGTKEGMNVIKKIKEGQLSKVALTNIEYCDLKNTKALENTGTFPANTNMLMMRLSSLKKAVIQCPFPGLLMNYKPVDILQRDGASRRIKVARIESTMQNIAEAFEEFDTRSIEKKTQDTLCSYITTNQRYKTISAIKKSFTCPDELLETPEACYIDLLRNARELLEKHCGFTVPAMPTEKEFLEKGPSFLFFYHPALGPLYEIIGQKLTRGVLTFGASLLLEIADIMIKDLSLAGALSISTPNVMGHFDQRKLFYSHRTGKCQLRDVRVENAGMVSGIRSQFWKNKWQYKEQMIIHLEENAEFIAEGVTFKGSYDICVPKNHICRATQDKKGKVYLEYKEQKNQQPFWKYAMDDDYRIRLKKT